MEIQEQYRSLPLLDNCGEQYLIREGVTEQREEAFLQEHLLSVYVQDVLTMKVICIPEHLAELVLGRLLTEGIIRSAEDVERIFICEHGTRARVFLKNAQPAGSGSFVETTPTCCTGNRILNDYFTDSTPPAPVVPIPWKPEWIFAMADRFADGMPLHSQTWATHSCLLARSDEILYACEDIGRHNALDKAIGFALRQGIPLSECMLYSSGRVPTDMVMKAIRAGVPLLASKASPTVQAVELAKAYRLTLICAARRDRMKLLHCPEMP